MANVTAGAVKFENIGLVLRAENMPWGDRLTTFHMGIAAIDFSDELRGILGEIRGCALFIPDEGLRKAESHEAQKTLLHYFMFALFFFLILVVANISDPQGSDLSLLLLIPGLIWLCAELVLWVHGQRIAADYCQVLLMPAGSEHYIRNAQAYAQADVDAPRKRPGREFVGKVAETATEKAADRIIEGLGAALVTFAKLVFFILREREREARWLETIRPGFTRLVNDLYDLHRAVTGFERSKNRWTYSDPCRRFQSTACVTPTL
jgi:hypothetical protein